MQITNPILPGFNPDPSIVRAGDDYYIATSTFEWFPGVQIHHSRDLVSWRLVSRPLSRLSQLDMTGNPDSGGIWAPCLTHADGLFWLVYTDVKLLSGAFKVTHNYLTTAPTIDGPWSEPVYLNSSGFDASLFHDDDGRRWLLNMDWSWRPGTNRFAGILLQEYDHEAQRVVGPIRRVFTGSPLGVTEGPHLYRRDGWYYLLTAEGGTGHEHAVTMARSRSIEGPYEIDPENPILTAHGKPDSPLKKAGHADIVETPDGWYMVHLCSRPIGEGVRGNDKGWSVLGRETAIQKVEWTEDGWLRLVSGGNTPQLTVPAPVIPELSGDAATASGATTRSDGTTGTTPNDGHRDGTLGDFTDEFDGGLSIHWQSPRRPLDADRLSLTARPGRLRLYGEEPPQSHFRQSLIARRQQSFRYTAETELEFTPEDYDHLAGLICSYNTSNFHYLYVTSPEAAGARGGGGTSDASALSAPARVVGIMSAAGGEESFPLAGAEMEVPATGALRLRATVDYERLQFACSTDGTTWTNVGPELDTTILSDEMGPGWGFTGAFVGICCQDMSGRRRHADFARFVYREDPAW